MGAPKGSHNAQAYHKAQVTHVRKALQDALDELAFRKVLFRNISTLAEHIASRVGQTAGNLRRNKHYRELLAHHLASQKGAVSIVSDQDRDVHTLRAKLIAAKLEAEQYRREKERLQLVLRHSGAKPIVPDDRPSKKTQSDIRSINTDKFESTARALSTLIDAAEVFKVDHTSKTIIDVSARPGSQLVVEKSDAKYFIEWLEKKRKLLDLGI